MTPVYLIAGAPASGKSTVARILAQRFDPGAAVSGDAFRRAIVSGRVEPEPDAQGDLSPAATEQLLLRYRIAAGVADAYAAAGITAVWQDVVLGPVLADAVAMIRARPFHVVVLAPPPDVLVTRNAARAVERGKDAYTAWQAAQLDAALRETTPRLGLWLDTSEQTPEQTVDEVLRRSSEAMIG